MSVRNRPLCLIPARGGSQRLPRKNIALLAGKPLLAYAIEVARESHVFDTICVSSEDEEILEVAHEYGADHVLQRPAELATETVQVKQVCVYLLEHFAAQGRAYAEFAVLLPTNPLRAAYDIQAAYELFKREDANVCMSLVSYAHPPQRAVWVPHRYVEPYFGLRHMQPTQLLDQTFRHDGSILFAKSEAFLREQEFYGSKVVPYFMPAERSVDIDSAFDLAWAEFLLSRASTTSRGALRTG